MVWLTKKCKCGRYLVLCHYTEMCLMCNVIKK